MAKYNTQANDMATTANNWQTPGATNLGVTVTQAVEVPVVEAAAQPRVTNPHRLNLTPPQQVPTSPGLL